MVNETPIQINISIASATEALHYWLSNIVFRHEVKIKDIHFNEKEHFTIKFDRKTEKEGFDG